MTRRPRPCSCTWDRWGMFTRRPCGPSPPPRWTRLLRRRMLAKGLMDGLAATKAPGYSHTQKAPLCLILYGTALACIVLAWIVSDVPGVYIAGGVILLIAAPAVHHLTVVDHGEVLAIRFGPIPLI